LVTTFAHTFSLTYIFKDIFSLLLVFPFPTPKMEQENAYRLNVSLDELGFNAENDSNNSGKKRKKYYNEDGTRVFKSKNLLVERRRREKHHSRLCTLRSLIPIITKASFLNFTHFLKYYYFM
jgi:hypothetical protein